VLSGFWIFLAYLIVGTFTIIGIPLGLANFKLITISLFPLVGKDIVSTHSVGRAVANGTVVGPLT